MTGRTNAALALAIATGACAAGGPRVVEPEAPIDADAGAEGPALAPDAGPPEPTPEALAVEERAAFARALRCEPPCRVLDERAAGEAEGKKLSTVALTTAEATSTCDARAHFLVTRDADGGLQGAPAPLFTTACEGGSVRVRPNEVDRVEQGSEKGIRWEKRTTYRLAPFARLREAKDAWSIVGPSFESTTVGSDAIGGVTRWFAPRCTRTGGPPPVGPVGQYAEFGERPARREYALLPRVEIEETFRASKWRTAHLGKCSALVSSTGASGFLVFGRPGKEEDASMRIVVSTRDEIFVEVKDDKWVGGKRGASVHDDQLEIWVGADLPPWQRRCLKASPPMAAYVIRLSDAKVTAGPGRPDLAKLTVERHAQTFGDGFGWVHFKLRFAKLPGALTFVYRDGDDGRMNERAIATSRFSSSDALSLGALYPIPPDVATCRVKDGALEPERSAD